MSRGWKQAGSSACLIVLVITLWVLFAPLQLGGAASYVVIAGQSMEPGIHSGDLVVVRRVAAYQVGEIAAYRAYEGRALVLHRIIGMDGDRLVFKGDNNSWTDTVRPTQGEVVGRMWFQIQQLGRVVRWLRNPLPFSLLAGLFSFALLAVAFEGHPPRKSRKGLPQPAAWFITRSRQVPDKESFMKASQPAKNGPADSGALRARGSILDGVIFLLSFAALAALLLGLFAFARAPWRETISTVAYQHSGAYAYAAEAPEGIYDSAALASGQPIFVALTCRVDLQFSYTLSGEQLTGLAGSHQLTARVTEQKTRWTRTFALEPETGFSGNSFITRATLDLCQLEELARSLEAATGIQAFYYSLTFEPQVRISGQLAGQELEDSFNPVLTFQFDPTAFYLVGSNPDEDPLNPFQAGQVTLRQMQANTLTLFNQTAEVKTLRRISLLTFGISAGLLLALFLFLYWSGKHDRLNALHLKHAALLVEVDSLKLPAGLPVFELKSLDDLARVAERQQVLILHQQTLDGHMYTVQAEQAVYRYHADRTQAPAPGKSRAKRRDAREAEAVPSRKTSGRRPGRKGSMANEEDPD